MYHRLKLPMLICLNTGLRARMMLPVGERKVLKRVVACKAALDIPLTGQAKVEGSRSEFLSSRQELFSCLPLTQLWEIRGVSGREKQPQPLLQKSPVSVCNVWEAPSNSPERMHQQQDQASAAVLLLRLGPKLRGRHLTAPTRSPG